MTLICARQSSQQFKTYHAAATRTIFGGWYVAEMESWYGMWNFNGRQCDDVQKSL